MSPEVRAESALEHHGAGDVERFSPCMGERSTPGHRRQADGQEGLPAKDHHEQHEAALSQAEATPSKGTQTHDAGCEPCLEGQRGRREDERKDAAHPPPADQDPHAERQRGLPHRRGREETNSPQRQSKDVQHRWLGQASHRWISRRLRGIRKSPPIHEAFGHQIDDAGRHQGAPQSPEVTVQGADSA